MTGRQGNIIVRWISRWIICIVIFSILWLAIVPASTGFWSRNVDYTQQHANEDLAKAGFTNICYQRYTTSLMSGGVLRYRAMRPETLELQYKVDVWYWKGNFHCISGFAQRVKFIAEVTDSGKVTRIAIQ